MLNIHNIFLIIFLINFIAKMRSGWLVRDADQRKRSSHVYHELGGKGYPDGLLDWIESKYSDP